MTIIAGATGNTEVNTVTAGLLRLDRERRRNCDRRRKRRSANTPPQQSHWPRAR
jgi:hypothetical protein